MALSIIKCFRAIVIRIWHRVYENNCPSCSLHVNEKVFLAIPEIRSAVILVRRGIWDRNADDVSNVKIIIAGLN